MNSTSSRAHTIVQIQIKQTTKEILNKLEKTKEKYSLLNIIDLAGSEKVGKTGAVGTRLTEAAAINKSLSTLG